MTKKIIEIKGLKKSFDGIVSVNNISLDIFDKTITSIDLITGENGAGKTTLFNLITGLEKSDSGQIFFNMEEISGLTPIKIAKKGIVRLYQQPRLFKNLTVLENLVAAAKDNKGERILSMIFKYKKSCSEEKYLKEKAMNLLLKLGLEEHSEQMAGELSYGQQKLIAFCMVKMNEAKLALLDEPFAGLNPGMIDRFRKMILEMRNTGITFLIIEHNLKKALPICNRHITLNEGRILKDIIVTPEEEFA